MRMNKNTKSKMSKEEIKLQFHHQLRDRYNVNASSLKFFTHVQTL